MPVEMTKLRPDQLEQRLQKCPAVLVPVGSLQWHGPHLPLGADTVKSVAACEAAAQKLGCVVAPSIGYGHCGSSRHRGSTISLPAQEIASLVTSLAEELHRIGFRVILFFLGHYEESQHRAIRQAVNLLSRRLPKARVAERTELDYLRGSGYDSDHGGPSETSLLRNYASGMVNMKKAKDHDPSVAPDPTRATTTLGKKIHGVIETGLIATVNELLNTDEK